MRLQSVAGESWRNLRSGTVHALRWGVVLAILAGGLALADVRTIVAVLEGADQFRDAGAAVQIVAAEQGIDGARCEALDGISGVTGAGAIRKGNSVTLAALPSTAVPYYEASPGLVALLGLDPSSEGVAPSEALAAVVGSPPSITLSGVTAPVFGPYRYPADGRVPTLEYALLGPVPSVGVFDACWVEVWPRNETVVGMLPYALTDGAAASGDAGTVALSQLNSTLGESYDSYHMIANRLTLPAGTLAAGLGLVIGFAAIMARRVEFASARHAGVGAAPLALQAALETLVWASASFLIATPAICIGSWLGNPGNVAAVMVVGAATVGGAASSAVVGAVSAAILIKERHLFAYFKDR